jgi:hypothetical protein
MFYIYASIMLCSLLGGCSWWGSSDSVESVTEEAVSASTSSEDNAVQEQPEEQKRHAHAKHEEEVTEIVETQPTPNSETKKDDVQIKSLQKKKAKKNSRREFKKRRARKKHEPYTPLVQLDTVQAFPAEMTGKPGIRSAPAQSASAQSALPQGNTAQTQSTLPQGDTAQAQAIMIQNAIDAKMLTVKHWTGTYLPTLLTITINGQVIPVITKGAFAASQPRTIPVTDRVLNVEYYYEFMNGMRKDTNKVHYTLAENATTLTMSFSWDTPWHVAFDHAQPMTSNTTC